MPEPVVVPDASVLLKWVLRSDDEDGRDRAVALKEAWLAGACEIVVPTLWAFEVGNVIGLKYPTRADELLGAMIDLRMAEAHVGSYRLEIFRLMREYGVTCYDAAYHALARVRNGTMVTADRRYAAKARRAGHVRLLDDWRPPGEAGQA